MCGKERERILHYAISEFGEISDMLMNALLEQRDAAEMCDSAQRMQAGKAKRERKDQGS